MREKYTGNLYIVAAPSGGGTTSLVKALVDGMDDIVVSISHTTRPIRPGEVNGVDYFFVDVDEFIQMSQHHAFVEHARVFDNFYGTSKSQIEERLSSGIDIVLDIDWQGALQIKQVFESAVSVYIIPPSIDALKQRLENRSRDNQETIRARMARAQDELSHYGAFDYLIVNDDFKHAAYELQSIVVAHRLRMARQVEKQRKLLSFLLG